MLKGERLVAHGFVLQGHGALGGIDLVLGEDDLVKEQIGPGIFFGVIIGVRVVGQDVGEGFALFELDVAGHEVVQLLAELKDLEIGGTVFRVHGCGHQLELAVMIEVGHGVFPLEGAVVLLELLEVRGDQLELVGGFLDGEQLDLFHRLDQNGGVSGGKRALAQRQNQDQHQKQAEDFIHLHIDRFLSSGAGSEGTGPLRNWMARCAERERGGCSQRSFSSMPLTMSCTSLAS